MQQVETLKLRLRMAMYKVSTNQTYVPLSHLQVPFRHSTSDVRRSISAALEVQPAYVDQSPSSHDITEPPSIIISPTKTTSPGTQSKPLGLLPTPLLRPTAYSSRFITSQDISPSPPSMSPNRAAQGLLSMASNSAPLITRQSLVCDDERGIAGAEFEE